MFIFEDFSFTPEIKKNLFANRILLNYEVSQEKVEKLLDHIFDPQETLVSLVREYYLPTKKRIPSTSTHPITL